MKYLTVRFRVRGSEVAAAEKAIIDFVAKVADEPATLRYESFREADGVSYLHFMSFADDAGEEAHRKTDHMKRFIAELYPKCEAQPVFTDLKMVSGAGR
jgi:quinol monooxygenase YgiN